jgi:hypothetical protein
MTPFPFVLNARDAVPLRLRSSFLSPLAQPRGSPGPVIPPGIPFNVPSDDGKDSGGARCSRERATFQTIKFSRRADRQTALSRGIMLRLNLGTTSRDP